MDFGLLDGLSFGEARERFAAELQAWYADPAGVRLPGAEVMAEVQARTWAALARLAGAHPGADVAVVAHGAVNRVLLAQALGLDLKRVMSLAQDYGCLNILEFWPDRVIVKGVNFLPGPRLPAEPFDKT
jgi:alpha-ribazole phosphatase/probable phosphoglycerate mutase